MAEIILHQYVTSPFSEKIRKIFAHKKVAWRAVEQPTIMPKPKLIPLTGGYRRIPVMQIGADVYCDTGIIIRKIDELFPEPTLYPDASEGVCHIINMWADRRMFFQTTPVIFEKLMHVVPKEFLEDRAKMMPRANPADIARGAPAARNHVRAFLNILDRQLSAHPFMLGGSFSLADAACFHPVWFLRVEPNAWSYVQKCPGVMRWFERVEAMGEGTKTPMGPDEALKIAAQSAPATRPAEDSGDPNGLKPGARVTVTADDYGFDPISGVTVSGSVYEIAIEREEPALGKIVNHFPKIGFQVMPA